MTVPTVARILFRPWSSTTSSPACCTNARRRTSARTCCCASTTAPTGRELVRRLHRLIDAQQDFVDPSQETSITVAFTYEGLKALGVPQASLDSFAPEFRAGMAARAADLGDVGPSDPSLWEQPLGTSQVHVAVAALSPDAERHQIAVDRARRAHEELPGIELVWSQDCYQLPTGRTSFGFKDGIGQPCMEGSGRPPTNPGEQPVKAGEIILGYPDETGELAPMPTPVDLGRNGTYVVFRKLHTRVAAYRQYLRARSSGTAEEELLGAKMVGRWQSGAPLAVTPDGDDPELGADPQRNNDFRYGDDPRGLKCPLGAHARRANPRDAFDDDGSVDVRLHRMIRRGTSYGPPLPAGVLEDDGADRGNHLRVRRRAPATPVRVRQDPVAQRRHLHRRPCREGPPGGTERRVGRLHHPATTHPAPAHRPSTVRHHPRRGVLLRPRAARDALAGRPRHLTDHDREQDNMTSANTGSRWDALDFGPPSADQAEPESPVLLEYLSEGSIAVVTLNRPHADNAITTELGARLTEAIEDIAVRTAVRVVILTGAGERAFSVGSDLRQRKNMTKEDWLRQRQDFDRTLYTVRQLRKPIFAAVNGIAYGGGSELAQSVDFIIASDNATFGQPEAMLGLAAGGGSPALLPRLLPRGRALQMLMTGDPITAEQAHQLGLVNEVHPVGELMPAALRIAEKIASNSPTAVQAVKRAVQLGEGQPIEQAIAIMMDAHWRSAVHPDRIEGIGAFNEGREPTFRDADF